jgi:group I intron endonuclease
MFGTVYKLTNTKTGKGYVGQTVQTLSARWVEHASHARNKTTDSYIGRAINKYGSEAFYVEVLHECESREELDFVEILYIVLLNTKVPQGYNMAEGGSGLSGWKNSKGHTPTEETRHKLSIAGKGNTNALGKKYPEEFGTRVSAALKNRVRHKESYEKMAATRRSHKRPLTGNQIAANTARRGKPWTEARRAAQKV